MRTVSIVCPVYREEHGIATFHRALSEVLAPHEARYAFRVLYCVDPAPDRTEDALREVSALDPRVEVLVMSRRFGHQAALVAGIDHCDSDAVVMLDSDGQHPPELIPTLIERWESGADIVQAVRIENDSAGLLKRSTSRGFYRLLNAVAAIDVRSGAADYRLLSANVVAVFRERLRERNMFMRGLVSWVGFNICHVEFEPRRREHGTSNYRASTLFNFALQGISAFSKVPLRIAIVAGLVISATSVLVGIAQVVAYVASGVSVPGWASLMAYTSLIGGIQLLFLGVLGEYVGQIFDEVKGRPRYLVARRYSAGRLMPDASTEGSGSRDR